MSVTARLEPLTIPTYPVGAPEKNPVFFEKRVYQGSNGKVYPVPFIDKVFDEPVDVTYLADTVILLRYFEAIGRGKRAVSVIKKRTGWHEDTIREYRISDKGLSLGEPLEEFQGVLRGVPNFVGRQSATNGAPMSE